MALYDLSADPKRRQFLTALSVFATGPAGLKQAIEAVDGEVDTGVPVVWTRDRAGNPDRVRVVSKERFRRLGVYHTLEFDRLVDRHGGVNGVSLQARSDDPTDITLDVYVDRVDRLARRRVPNRVRRVPTTLRERRRERIPGRVCRRRILEFYDPLPANPKITGQNESGDVFGGGTLGLVAWNADATDPYECFVTAHHVTADSEGKTAPLLQHSGLQDDTGRIESVGRYETHTPLGERGLDGVKYRSTGAVSPAPLETASTDQGRVSGSWDFTGLTDATADDSIAVDFAGSATCYAEAKCVGTERNDLIDYQVTISPQVVTNGDSGGPFLDSDDKLVCLFSNYCCEEAHGPVATELLDRLGVALSPSSGNGGR